ncbi:rhodanese-like domain-containing protein [Riemerella columbina]|uniref:rhodanese-like domain-containing protein n=1 Tax=Riemerella columbina TaxID=103810 RepID=UPI0026704D21|nr:rhodanese-like domain-containing protein [Riemerella columbina]WKS94448.1 rhodanese-like domain-containing protein [Riemerella columbina]
MIKDILKSGQYHLIDVREEMELMMDGEIEGAINIPLGSLEDRKAEIIALDGDKIFFCRSGNRSGKAVEFLQSEGVEKVHNGGGYADLQALLDTI